jgi:hypothetical protein
MGAASAGAAATASAAQQQLPYNDNAGAAAAVSAHDAQDMRCKLAGDGSSSSSSALPSSVLLQQLLLEHQHLQQMQQQVMSQPLPNCRGTASSTASLSMPLSSGSMTWHHGNFPPTQQQQQSYDAPMQQQQQYAQTHGRRHSTDSNCSSSSTSGVFSSSSKGTKAAAPAIQPGGFGAEQLLEAMGTLNEELQQLQQLRNQLAAAAEAAHGTPVAAACQAAAQLHEDTVHQALAVKAAMEVTMAVQGSAAAVHGAATAAAAAAAAAAAGSSGQVSGPPLQSQTLAAAIGGGVMFGDGSCDTSTQLSCTVGSTV